MSNPNYFVNLDRISLFDLKNYLIRNGWIRTSSNEKYQVFTLKVKSNSPLELVLPHKESFIDISDRIKQAVEAISQIEDKTVSEIILKLICENTDSVKIPTTPRG